MVLLCKCDSFYFKLHDDAKGNNVYGFIYLIQIYRFPLLLNFGFIQKKIRELAERRLRLSADLSLSDEFLARRRAPGTIPAHNESRADEKSPSSVSPASSSTGLARTGTTILDIERNRKQTLVDTGGSWHGTTVPRIYIHWTSKET